MIEYKSKLLSSVEGISYNFGSKSIEPVKRNIFTLNQIHSSKVIFLENTQELRKSIDGDAIVTTQKGFNIGVKTADCVPILLTDVNATFVAAIHSGWRGTYYKIITNTLNLIFKKLKINPRDIVGSLGPSISLANYEVSEDMWIKFKKKFNDSGTSLKEKNNKFFIDLSKINISLLKSSGVTRIDMINECTYSNNDFYSYRRDKSLTANQISNIMLN